MMILSRSMLPRMLRSASRLCGGRRSTSPFSRGMSSLLPGNGDLLLLLELRRDDHDLDLGDDIVAQGEVHDIQAAFLDEALELDHVRLDLEVFALECLGNLYGADGTVEMFFIVGRRLDGEVRHALDLLGERL